MVDAALNVAAEQVIEHSAYGALLQRGGNRGPTAAPQNVYRTNEIDEFGRLDSWVAVAVATDAQWAGLCDALGRPEWATIRRAGTAPGRRAHHDLIDEHLAAVVRRAHRRRDRRSAVGRRSSGGQGDAAAPPDRDSSSLSSRGLLRDRRPSGQSGDQAQHHAVPVLRAARERVHRTPAPLLGQHNHEVLTELGFTDDEIGATRGGRGHRHDARPLTPPELRSTRSRLATSRVECNSGDQESGAGSPILRLMAPHGSAYCPGCFQ